MPPTAGGSGGSNENKAVLAGAFAAAAAAGLFLATDSVRMEAAAAVPTTSALTTPEYENPPKLPKAFGDLAKGKPKDEAFLAAWCVKNLDVKSLKSLLEKTPNVAATLDAEDNTLFHLLASESEICAKKPEAARETVKLLLEVGDGWKVADLKNQKGERADVVAKKADPGGIAQQLIEARSKDFREPLRYEKPITLVSESTPCPWEWQTLLADEQRRSWAAAFLGAVPPEKCKAWFDVALHEAPWEALPDVPRKVVWYVDEEFMDCPYRYSGLEFQARPFPPWMKEIRKEVCALCGIPPDQLPNSCNMNVYEDNRGEVGWHSDDEAYFQGLLDDATIISFSLGAPRPFCWRMGGTTETLGCVPVGNGDIMTMEGMFQRHYKHCVPAMDTPCKERINMTFRWIKVKAHAVDAETKAA